MRLFSHVKIQLTAILVIYLVLASLFASVKLDIDEFTFIKEPYELLGGDYTKGYLKSHSYRKAIKTVIRSYLFYWNYRPLFSPVISEQDKLLFAEEERLFGYSKPDRVDPTNPNALALYSARLIVPEPDRFYRHGAGKPLLPALLSIPQLALVAMLSDGRNLLTIQHNYNYHPLFVLTRIVQILSGLLTILLIYFILRNEFDEKLGNMGAAICAFFPISIQYFPNLHHDSVMVPFLLAAGYLLAKSKPVLGGVAYGLALASKNTAIFLLPVLLLYYLWKGHEAYTRGGLSDGIKYLRKRVNELIIFGIISFAVLMPFANPLSYAKEILTPITHRTFDPRGENVEEFFVTHTLKSNDRSVAGTAIRPEVKFVQQAFGMGSVFFFFIVLAISFCFQSDLRDISKISLIMLIMTLPYGIVFGYGLGYRQLMFVPFFSLLCAQVLTIQQLKVLMWTLLCMGVLYSVDPISTNTLHTPTQ